MSPKSLNRNNTWLLGIILLAVIIRLLFLSHNSLWFDEAYSVNEALKPVETLLSGTDSRHPPLYYVFLHYWVQIFGTDEWSARLPSALASMINLGLLYLLGKRLFSKEVGLAAVLLLSFSPLDIWYAQEARMYMLVTFMGLTYAVVLLWTSYWRLFLLIFILAVGFYLDYTAIPLFIGLTTAWFVYWWRYERKLYLLVTWGVSFAAAAVLYIPWWSHFKSLLDNLSKVHVFSAFRDLFNLPLLSAQHYLLALLLLSISLFLILNILVTSLEHTSQAQLLSWVFVAGLIFSLPLLAWPRFYTIKRIVVTGWPYIILLAAWFICHLQRKRQLILWGITFVSLIAATGMVLFVDKDDWRALAEYQALSSQHTSPVWVDPVWNEIALKYYSDAVIEKGDIADLSQLASSELWFVAERLPSQTIPTSESEVWLDQNMEFVEGIPFTRLELRFYRPR